MLSSTVYSNCKNIDVVNVIFNSYTIGTSGLPDIYTRGLQAQALRVYISGKPRVHMV